MPQGSGGSPKMTAVQGKARVWKTTKEDGCGEATGRLGVGAMANPSVSSSRMLGTEAVVFSIQFYGKTIGEVGLMDQDLSELDWAKFKSYIFQNLLSVNNQENICVSYSDDEGDKLPIDSEEEYREALKVAKKKSEAQDKLVLDITRQGSLPTVFSIVSSGIKRVSSSPPKEGGISFFKTASPPKESTSFGGRSNGQDRTIFSSLFSSDRISGDGDMSGGGARAKDEGSFEQPPKWFNAYMNKFREELTEDVLTKLTEVIRVELAVSSNAEQPEEYPRDKCSKAAHDSPALKDQRTKSDLLHYSPFDFSQELKLPKVAPKVIRSDQDIKKDFPQPPQQQANPPPATNSLPDSNDLKADSVAPLKIVVARRHQRKSCNPQKRISIKLERGNKKEGHTTTETHYTTDSTEKEENAKVQRERRYGDLQLSNPQKRSSFQSIKLERDSKKERPSLAETYATEKEENAKVQRERRHEDLQLSNPHKRSSFQSTLHDFEKKLSKDAPGIKGDNKKKEDDIKENSKVSDSGVKRKKSGKMEEERFIKWLEKKEQTMTKEQEKAEERFVKKHDKFDERLKKIQEEMVMLEKQQQNLAKKRGKVEERFLKKYEKIEERLAKKHEKIAERLNEKAEKKRMISNSTRLLEMEKSNRTQGKVLAKMEGLRKKQTCTPEELSKLRKVVDKHHKAASKYYDGKLDDLRRLDRRVGKARPERKQAFPVDASLLHNALLELEALAEDAPNEGHNSATLGYNAFYVNDITYPDGSRVAPGAKFVKTWRVLNSGIRPWNEKTELCKWTQVQVHGSPVYWKLKPLEKKVVCPPLKPGECGNISITFIAAEEPGWYATHWRFCQNGRVFGNQIWCAVYVSSDADSDYESQTKVASDKADADSTQRNTEEEKEDKDNELSSSAKHSLEDLVPSFLTFMDSAKEMNKAEGTVGATVEEVFADPTLEAIAIAKLETEPDCHEEPQTCQQSEYEVGIVENYYDAEDPPEENTKKQCVNASCQDGAAKASQDLISFEEEAELIPSEPVSPPDTYSDLVVLHSVMPLKDMARESVDTLKDFLKDSAAVKEDHRTRGELLEEVNNALEELSLSSESFSDLDSDDQAILNESDSDFSDQDYFVVTMPECFNLTLPYSTSTGSERTVASHPPIDNNPDAERPDSPDFLTADEDDRMTATAANGGKYQDEPATETASTVDDVEASSLTGLTLEDQLTTDTETENEKSQYSEGSKVADGDDDMPSLPGPPTDTKAFMDIPPEALRTNLAVDLMMENTVRSETQESPKPQESGQANWGSGAEERQEVVCEQPLSAQGQGKPSPACDVVERSTTVGASAASSLTSSAPDQANGDGVAALPDDLVRIIPEDLVRIIPEDLVRGVWNTARTFITHINQEMLSPSSNGSERVADSEDVPESTTPPNPSQEPSQGGERRRESVTTTTAEVREEPASLPAPMQQLADMGFTDHVVNQRLLTKYNNDVARAVAELIVLNCQ